MPRWVTGVAGMRFGYASVEEIDSHLEHLRINLKRAHATEGVDLEPMYREDCNRLLDARNALVAAG